MAAVHLQYATRGKGSDPGPAFLFALVGLYEAVQPGERGGEVLSRQARGPSYPSQTWFRMADDIDSRRRRAAYRASHRGTKEMDWVLGRYSDAALGAMSGEALSLFERLLALPDPDLRDMILPPQTAPPAEFAELIAAVRTFHGLGEEC